MEQSVLEYAAQIAQKANGSKPSFMNTVLSRWHDADVHTLSQAQTQEDSFKKSTMSKPAGDRQKTVSAQQYAQREYTSAEQDEMQNELFKEAMKRYG